MCAVRVPFRHDRIDQQHAPGTLLLQRRIPEALDPPGQPGMEALGAAGGATLRNRIENALRSRVRWSHVADRFRPGRRWYNLTGAGLHLSRDRDRHKTEDQNEVAHNTLLTAEDLRGLALL
jgi:hypothetical protein